MHTARLRPLTLAFGVSLLLALVPATALAATGNISGTLTDDDTGGFASGVSVGECGPPGCPGVNGTSNASGAYTLTGVPSGGGWNVLTNPGACASTDYAKGHKYGVNVNAGSTTTGVDMHLTKQKGSISGRVLNLQGSPVANVSLVVDNSQTGGFGYGNTTSAADGSYTVSCLAAAGVAGSGSYFITAFPPAGSPYGQQQDAGIVVPIGGTASHNVILGSGGGTITGKVTCGAGTCPAPISVLVFCDGCASSANVTSDASGNYTASNLAGGHTYDVHAIAPSGYDNSIRYSVSVANGAATVINLSLTPSGPSTSGRVTGTIIDGALGPWKSCLINVFGGPSGSPYGSFVEGDVYTAADGTFDTGYRLPPGGYIVFVDCPSWPEGRANNGVAVNVSVGGTATANYTLPEVGRPFTGGHDAIGVAAGSTQAFFAEGFTGYTTGYSFHEYLTVQNPGAAQTLTVKYLLASGGPIVVTHALPAQSRTTIDVNTDVGPNQDVSAWLTAPNPFVAERPMYFLFPGGVDGGDNVMGAQSLGTTFYFAEGYTGPGFNEYLTLMNTSTTTTANVQVTYYFKAAAPKTVSHPVSPSSRLTVTVNNAAEAGANQEVSMKVTSDIAILAERPIYFNWSGKTGGEVVVGATAPQSSLNLAEGHVGGGFDQFLTILNPNASQANLTITYYRGSGAPVLQSVSVAANSRYTIHVNDVLPAGTDNSVHITSSQPIVVERPMYFTIGSWTGGHDAVAVPDIALSTTLNFAEGYVGPTFAEYYTILNSSATAANVTLTYFLKTGGPVVKTITVAPNSRFTETVAADLPAGSENSVQITSNVPLLAERPMYFAY